MSFPKYPEYKDSGVEWLGEIPNHWDIRRLKHIATAFPSNIDKKAYEDEEVIRLCNYVDVYYNEEIREGLPFMEASATRDQIEKFSLRAGDTIITKDSETADDIAIASYVPEDVPGVVCGYHLTMVRPRKGFAGRFIKRLFDSRFLKSQFEVAARGLTRVGLSQYAIDNILVTSPPANEQSSIAAFLDRETAKIDSLVAEQEKLIELLKEKRQAVISHAVTKGLDPNVPMKDSGVEWLGEVPEHWELTQLKYVVALGSVITYGIVQAGPHVEDGIPYIKTSDMSGASLPLDGYSKTSFEIDKSYSRSKVSPGDIVVAIRATVGKCLLVPEELDGANLTQGTAKVSPGSSILNLFLLHQMNSLSVQTYFELMAKGATFREITLDALRRTPITVPPLEEQKQIIVFLEGKLCLFDDLQREAQSTIDLLRERRAALISAAVTGKIDVRELAEVL